jgi:hypothetical protein
MPHVVIRGSRLTSRAHLLETGPTIWAPRPDFPEAEQVEVKCEFCKRDYVLEGKELEEAYAQTEKKDAE